MASGKQTLEDSSKIHLFEESSQLHGNRRRLAPKSWEDCGLQYPSSEREGFTGFSAGAQVCVCGGGVTAL